jgi:hypothetical protein
LTQTQLDQAAAAAVARWQAAGLDAADADRLRRVRLVVANLSGVVLGLRQPGVIYIDANAAGQGWFVDATPLQDEEFQAGQALPGTSAYGRVDLETVLAHEFGHELGLGDGADNSVMGDALPVGVRRSPTRADVDAVFALYQ